MRAEPVGSYAPAGTRVKCFILGGVKCFQGWKIACKTCEIISELNCFARAATIIAHRVVRHSAASAYWVLFCARSNLEQLPSMPSRAALLTRTIFSTLAAASQRLQQRVEQARPLLQQCASSRLLSPLLRIPPAFLHLLVPPPAFSQLEGARSIAILKAQGQRRCGEQSRRSRLAAAL